MKLDFLEVEGQEAMDTTLEILTWSKEEEIYCDGGQTLEQVAQRDYVITFLGDFYSPIGCSPE